MEKKIKILFVIPYYVPAFSYGGPVKVSSDLAEGLVKKGHSVTVVTTDVLDKKNRTRIKSEVINGVAVVRCKNVSNYLAKQFNLYLPIGFRAWLKKNIAEYDIVHCHDFFTILNILTSNYCKKLNIPYIIQPHGCLDMIRQKSKLFRIKQAFLFLFKGVVDESEYIIALVDKEKDEIETVYRNVLTKIKIIPNGIDYKKNKNIREIDLHHKYNIPDNNKIIVFLGRVQYIKGLDISIKSLAAIKDRIDFSFLIIGPDEGERNKLYNLIEKVWPWLIEKIGSPDGTIAAEYITNIDAMYIIMFQIIVSTIIMKWKPLTSMMTGFFVCSIGMSLTLFTNNPFFIIASIFIFAVGEMSGSPKITEYIGKIAPKDKIALYMGMSFLPVTLGNLLAGYISGGVYGRMSDKVTLLQNDFASKGLSVPEISNTFTQTDLYNKAGELLNMTQTELTNYLWTSYNPGRIWVVLLGIGIGASFLLFLYDRFLIRKAK